MMGLSGASNAHGQLASETGYSHSLCCTDGNTTCTGTNEILSLSSSTNAHAEGPYQPNYNNPVCYGYLDCVSVAVSDCSQTDPFRPIPLLSISASTNAHLGEFSAYSTKICCLDRSPFPTTCDLTDAQWTTPEVEQGHTAIMQVDGVNCSGGGTTDGINFTIYKKNFFLGFWTGNTLVTWITGNFPSESWPVSTGQSTGVYFFNATSVNSGDRFSSLDGSGNDEIEVTATDDPVECDQVDVCEDIPVDPANPYPELDCNANNGLTYCNLDLSGDARVDPSPPAGYSYNCTWDPTTTTCSFMEYYGGPGEDNPLCGNGQTLCFHDASNMRYCYPGEVCPGGDEPFADGIQGCEVGEGCSNPECGEGAQDSCVAGTTCKKGDTVLEGKCYGPGALRNETQCSDGFNLCLQTTSGLNYCYPGTPCPTNPETGIPDEDIPNVCTPPSVDVGGICTDATAPLGRCVKGYISTGDTCDDDGFLTYQWDATWQGSGTTPAWCTNGTATIECPAQIPLPLFTPVNAIITIAAIAAIYLVIALAKSRKKKGKKKI